MRLITVPTEPKTSNQKRTSVSKFHPKAGSARGNKGYLDNGVGAGPSREQPWRNRASGIPPIKSIVSTDYRIVCEGGVNLNRTA